MSLFEKHLPKPELKCNQGFLRFTPQEWEDTYKLLLKKKPELIELFKQKSMVNGDYVVVMNGDECLFREKDTEPWGCTLRQLLHICPNTCSQWKKE